MINQQLLYDLEAISSAVGNRPEYVQGGGGNTSVKLDEELMAIKASGFKLRQVTSHSGFAVVNYSNVKEFLKTASLDSNLDPNIDYENEITKLINESVVELDGLQRLKPSVEVGFHSVLKKYVIHTHSVYANILCCSKQGSKLTKKIFPERKWNVIWIPYVNPGFYLALKIFESIETYRKEKGFMPNVFLMENHGLVVTDDNKDSCIELHSMINNRIKQYFEINEPYPEIIIEKKDNKYFSKTSYLKNFFINNKEITNEFFENIILYPDQLVYLNDSISVNGEENILNINTENGDLVYNTNIELAQTIEETLLAYIYVINKIKECGMEVKSMTKQQVDYIRNWESEKYRKRMV